MSNEQIYIIISQAVEFCVLRQKQHPSLEELASHVGLSEFYLQRLFSEWVGISPKKYLQFLTKEYALEQLNEHSLLDVSLSSGLSGTGRLHDLVVSCEGMTPGEYKQLGKGLLIEYGYQSTPFGECMVATTSKGICKLAFFDSSVEKEYLTKELHDSWGNALIKKNEVVAQTQLNAIFPFLDPKGEGAKPCSFHVLMKGSPFQLKVWEALLSLQSGSLGSYQQVANYLGMPSSVRAVASAVAKNNIAYLIPCHRVIRSNGDFGQYRWGANRKRTMLAWEAAKESN